MGECSDVFLYRKTSVDWRVFVSMVCVRFGNRASIVFVSVLCTHSLSMKPQSRSRYRVCVHSTKDWQSDADMEEPLRK